MTENFWQTKDLIRNFPDSQNLGDVIKAVTNWNRFQGRVVCSITVNGVRLREYEEEKFSKTKLNEIQEVKVESETPQNLLDESLMSCREYIEKTAFAFDRIPELLRQNQISYALHYQEVAMEAFSVFYELITHIRVVYEMRVGTLPKVWEELEEKAPLLLSQVVEAYEKKDYQLAADILEYDVAQTFNTWRDELRRICEPAEESEQSA